jgi:hypothetical protein
MSPFAILLGILMGSIVAIATSLIMVLIVFLILGGEQGQLHTEIWPLLRSVGLFAPLAAVAWMGFVGELRRTRWRGIALAAMWSGIALVSWVYWPRG